MQSMLRFLYHGEVAVSTTTTPSPSAGLGRLADMYELPALRTAVLSAARVAAAEGPASAAAVLSTARAAGLMELEPECWEMLLEAFAAAAAAAAAAADAGGEWLLAMPEYLFVELLAMACAAHAHALSCVGGARVEMRRRRAMRCPWAHRPPGRETRREGRRPPPHFPLRPMTGSLRRHRRFRPTLSRPVPPLLS